jgi:hypothetical protein
LIASIKTSAGKLGARTLPKGQRPYFQMDGKSTIESFRAISGDGENNVLLRGTLYLR